MATTTHTRAQRQVSGDCHSTRFNQPPVNPSSTATHRYRSLPAGVAHSPPVEAFDVPEPMVANSLFGWLFVWLNSDEMARF